jgi:hypothetical protein
LGTATIRVVGGGDHGGIPPEDILAMRDWRNSERLTPADRAILAATDECLAGKSISDAAWAEVAKHRRRSLSSGSGGRFPSFFVFVLSLRGEMAVMSAQ